MEPSQQILNINLIQDNQYTLTEEDFDKLLNEVHIPDDKSIYENGSIGIQEIDGSNKQNEHDMIIKFLESS